MSRDRCRSPQYDSSFKGYRLFVGDIGGRVGKYDLEREFDQYGPLIDIWVARNPPGFAYVVYKHKEDSEEAVRKLHGRYVCGRQVRVEFARPYPGPAPKINYVPRNEERQHARSRSRSPRHKNRRSRSRSRDRPLKGNSHSEDRYRGRRSRSPSHRQRSRSRDRGYSGGSSHIENNYPRDGPNKRSPQAANY